MNAKGRPYASYSVLTPETLMNGHGSWTALVVFALVHVAFVASCWSTHLDDCRYACGPRGTCPQGMICTAGMCASVGVTCPGVGDASVDGYAHGDAEVVAPPDVLIGSDAREGNADGAGDRRSDAEDGGEARPPDSGDGADARYPNADAAGEASHAYADDGGDGGQDRQPGGTLDSTDSVDGAGGETTGPPQLIPVTAGIAFAGSKAWKSPAISVCWEQPDFATERQWVMEAAADSWQAVSAVRFTGWGDCDARGANLQLRFETSAPRPPLIGTDADHIAGGVQLESGDIAGCVLSSRQACVAANAVHRLGHALGFLHALAGGDDTAACPQAVDGGQADGAPAAPVDEGSVMTFCNPTGRLSAFRLGAHDILGVAEAYSAGPSAFVFQDASSSLREVATIDVDGTFVSQTAVTIADATKDAQLMLVGHNGSILFHNRSGGGRFDVGRVSDTGTVTLNDSATGVGAWPMMTAVQNGYFLAYDPARDGGAVAVFRVDALGKFGGRTDLGSGVGANWTDIVGMPNGEVLFYGRGVDDASYTNVSHGMLAKLTPVGKLVIQRPSLPCCFAQYDLLAAANMNAIMLYKRAVPGEGTGLGQISTFAVNGEYANAEFPVPNMPAYLESLTGARNGTVLLYNDALGAKTFLSLRIANIRGGGHYTPVDMRDDLGHFSFMSGE